jgi:3-dehydroquinate synthase
LNEGIRLEVKSINGNYFATFHTELVSVIKSITMKKDVYIVIDLEVSKRYPSILSLFAKERFYVVESKEENKSLSKVAEITEWLLDLGATKSSHLVGIGGGVVQDLTTFSSHIYYRGISWTFVPTTLLSQADSCIGAKCALNLKGYKNQLGVVHTPSAVEIFPGFLGTLPFPEIQSGFGEITKLAVTGEDQFLGDFKEYLQKHNMSLNAIAELIFASLRSKIYVINQDEYESDLRRILNYGHSFGHALESLTGNSIVHGDAVIVGMDIINFIGIKLEITDYEFYLDMKELFDRYFKHIAINKRIEPQAWVYELKHDKKMKDGKMNFAIPHSLGDIRIHEMDLDESLVSIVREYLEDSSFFHTS